MLRTALIALLALLLVAPAAAAQSTRNKILRECQTGSLSGDYTAREIRDARNNIPDDLDQYSDCRDVLTAALLNRAAGGTGGGGGTGGSGGGGLGGAGGTGGTGGGGLGGAGGTGGGGELLSPTTPADRDAVRQAGATGAQPVDVNGRRVTPGAAAFRNDLPATLLVLLILLAVAAAAALAPAVRRRGLAPLAALGPAIRRVLPGRSG
jgi:hypothetical protein